MESLLSDADDAASSSAVYPNSEEGHVRRMLRTFDAMVNRINSVEPLNRVSQSVSQ